MSNPILDSLPCDTDTEQTGSQAAWHAVVHLVVPCTDLNGTAVDSAAAASDYISETLRGRFLDWGYVLAPDVEGTGEPTAPQTPIPILVCDPYIEGTFLGGDD